MKRLLRFLWRFLHRHKYVRLHSFGSSRALDILGCERCDKVKMQLVDHPPGCTHDLLFSGGSGQNRITYWRCLSCKKDWAENTNPEKAQWLELPPNARITFEGDQIVLVGRPMLPEMTITPNLP
jgi:hypothetical protein